MTIFNEQKELIKFAKTFIDARIDALEKDVHHCLSEPLAPFPAILLCFATIDLLGALSEGNAVNKPTKKSKQYMQKYMYYTQEQTDLLMGIFRHKIVHLGQPKQIIENNDRKISWRYHHSNPEIHLKLIKFTNTKYFEVTSQYRIEVDYEFNICISEFVKDIKNSVYEPEGYIHSLKKDTNLQDKFEKAIKDYYDPKK